MAEQIMLAAAALPMGDDTPVMMYALIGGVALALLIAVAAMSKLAEKNKKKQRKQNKNKKQDP